MFGPCTIRHEKVTSLLLFREHSTIAKLFRDKELEYNDELLDHNRRVHFLGAHEETAASHALYHPRGVDYYEMIGPKQVSFSLGTGIEPSTALILPDCAMRRVDYALIG